jgi:tetratricopeptide (TPR) repeat protein
MELSFKKKEPTLCLNMILKNESKIITRLLDSVLPIIDTYCICDTGSTDDTIDIINNYFKDKNIHGKIITEPFKNFCYNRNFSLNSCIGMSDFIILLDADMIIQLNNFNKNLLNTSNSFTILQGNDSFFYKNMRIIQNNGLYKYIGVTHEYVDAPPNSTISSFEKNQIFILDYGDGGCKNDKFQRDIQLLIQGIQDEPNNDRYHFYLANSYHDSGQFTEAISYYLKRIELGGWKEEIWYSYYRIGLCYKNLNLIHDAIFYWMEGMEYYPQRLENVYEMIQFYRINNKHKLCNLFYNYAINILNTNDKRDNYLFLHNDVYTYKLFYEFTIFASYVGIHNINNQLISVFNNTTNDLDLNNVLHNMKFYKDILIQQSKIILDNNFTTTINTQNINLNSSSSCLIPYNNGYLMNIRYVNYYINPEGRYLNCDNNIITINKCIHLDTDLKLISEKWIELTFDNRKYIGVEDVRIFFDIYTNQTLFIGTSFHLNNTIGIATGNYDLINYTLNTTELTQTFHNTECEKNWVFVDYNNSTHIIYNWHPLQICKINSNNTLDLVIKKEMPLIFSRIRGSTCGFKYLNISLNTEIWFVTHIVSYENPRHYYHLISVFDQNMNLLKYSAPFKFEGEPIEYCLSILVEHNRVLINYSTWDRTTRIGIYDKIYIDSILKYT